MSDPKRAGRVSRKELNDRFNTARAMAIQSYANVEQALCELFAYLSDTSPPVAGTIFFRITNSRSRVAILQQLLKLKRKDEFQLFFNSVVKFLRPIDDHRNEIVHWHGAIVISQNEHGLVPTTIVLQPPNYWARNENTPEWDADRLDTFADNCTYIRGQIAGFTDFLNGREAFGFPPSTEIYQQPLTDLHRDDILRSLRSIRSQPPPGS